MVTPARIVALLPIDARRFTSVGTTVQSASVCRLPSALTARGCRSLVNITPWPTNTPSSSVTPSQMNVWLEILQWRPIDGVPLNLDERADPRSVADRAAVQVDQIRLMDDDVFFENDAGGDHLEHVLSRRRRDDLWLERPASRLRADATSRVRDRPAEVAAVGHDRERIGAEWTS